MLQNLKKKKKKTFGIESTTELNQREWEVYDWKCVRKSKRQKALIRPYASVMQSYTVWKLLNANFMNEFSATWY